MFSVATMQLQVDRTSQILRVFACRAFLHAQKSIEECSFRIVGFCTHSCHGHNDQHDEGRCFVSNRWRHSCSFMAFSWFLFAPSSIDSGSQCSACLLLHCPSTCKELCELWDFLSWCCFEHHMNFHVLMLHVCGFSPQLCF